MFASAALHLLALLAYFVEFPEANLEEPRSESPITMVFETTPQTGGREVAHPPPGEPEPQPPAPPPVPASPPPQPPAEAEATPRAEAPPPPREAPPPAPVPEAVPPPAPPTARPQPTSPPRPTPQQQARPAPRPPSDFPAPFNFSWPKPAAPNSSQAQSRVPPGQRGIDLSPGPAERYNPAPPRRIPGDADASIQVTGAQVGSDWINGLHAWWVQHRYYPSQAAKNGEDGMVKIHLSVDRTGKVNSVELVSRSGSQWLDMAAVGTFRGAILPPFPPSTPERTAEIDLTIQYILIRR